MVVVEFRQHGSSDEYHAGIISEYENERFFIESEAPDLRCGDQLELMLKTPGRDLSVIASGNVVTVQKKGFGFRAEVKLNSMSVVNQKTLDEIVESAFTPDSERAEEMARTMTAALKPAEDFDKPDKVTEMIMSAVEIDRAAGSLRDKIANDHPEGTQESVPDNSDICTDNNDPSSDELSDGEEGTQKGVIRVLSRIVISFAAAVALAITVYYVGSGSRSGDIQEELVTVEKETFAESISLPDELDLAYDEGTSSPDIHGDLREIKPVNVELVSNEEIKVGGSESEINTLSSDKEDVAETMTTAVTVPEKKEISQEPLTGGSVEDESAQKNIPVVVLAENALDQSLESKLSNGVAEVDKRYIIHVSAWQTDVYAKMMIKKIRRTYPNAFTLLENDYYVVMIPDVKSREEAAVIVEDLIIEYDVEPLVYVQQRMLPGRE